MSGDFRFINLTSHEITIVDASGRRLDIASHGLARVAYMEYELQPIGDIPVVSSPSAGSLFGMPGPMDGIVFIVSREVLNHPDVAGRDDVYSPATRSRHNPYLDHIGRVIGVTRLVKAPSKS